MAEFKNPIDQLIGEIGGTVVVANALGVAPSVVSTWRGKGQVPSWRRLPLRLFIEAKRKELPMLSIPKELVA